MKPLYISALFSFLLLSSFVSSAGIQVYPTFSNCSVDFTSETVNPTVEYREKGKKWNTVPDFHGSIMGLKEDTVYEVRIVNDGKTLEQASFKTWSSKVRIGKTVEIDPATYQAPLVISDKGTPDAWVRYVVKGGVLDNKTDKATIIVDGAEYVLIDDMTLRGAKNCINAIRIENSRQIRVRNCDIAGWSREGVQNFQRLTGDKRFGPGNGSYVDKRGKPINDDPAINIRKGASEIVVERCFIHDPVSTSVSWYYHHPEGPDAIAVAGPDHSTVIRWNDFIGSDRHRWNDGIAGPGNFSEHGGFNNNADIYGNFMIFANDDCIEVDGGQHNVRCYGNRFEGALCGVSVQGCMVGPSLVFDNWFTGMGEEFGMYGQTIKTGGGKHGENSYSYIWNNVFWGLGTGVSERDNLGTVVNDNRFCGTQKLNTNSKSVRSSNSGNEYGVKIDESEIDPNYPKRPLPFTLDRARISVGLSREPVTIKINGKLPKGCVIRKPDPFDWFDVKIDKDRLTVTFDDSKMQHRHDYRGAFIVRTPDGLSRPVSIYAETKFLPPIEPLRDGVFTQYVEGFSLKPGDKKSVSFDIEKTGRYWIMLHGKGSVSEKPMSYAQYPRPSARVDNDPFERTALNLYAYPTWTMFNPGGDIYTFVRHYDLEAGHHTVDFDASNENKPFELDGFVITDDPAAFEPNRTDFFK